MWHFKIRNNHKTGRYLKGPYPGYAVDYYGSSLFKDSDKLSRSEKEYYCYGHVDIGVSSREEAISIKKKFFGERWLKHV